MATTDPPQGVARPDPEHRGGERHALELLMRSPAIVWVFRGPDHVVEFGNDRARATINHRQPLLGLPLLEAVPELAGQPILATLDRVYATGEPHVDTEAPVASDATGTGSAQQHHYSYVFEPLRDAAGRVDGVMVHAFDVTPQVETRRRTEALAAELALERERLRAVVDQMPAGVVVAEAPSGRVVAANRRVAELWGERVSEGAQLGDYSGFEGFHPDGRPYRSEEWPMARAIARGETVQGERIDFRREDGTRGTLETSAAPVRDATGAIVAGVVSFQDVTGRRRRERNTALLADTANLVSTSLDSDEVMRSAARATVTHLADACTVTLAGRDGVLERTVVVHVDPAKEAAIRAMPVAQEGPGVDVLHTGRSLLVAQMSDEMLATGVAPDQLESVRGLDQRSVLVVPLPARGRILGTMGLSRGSASRPFDAEDQATVEELARRVAVALDNAALFAAEQSARAAAERARARAGVMADIGIALDTPLGVEGRLRRLAERVVPWLADYCTVDLREPDGSVTLAAAVAGDERMEAHLRRVRAAYSRVPERADGIAGVMRTGEPLLLAEISPQSMERYAAESGHAGELLESLRALRPTSSLVVPLSARGEVVGAMSLGTTGTRRRLSGGDLRLAVEIGRRAGLAVDNARLYEAERRTRERVLRLQSVTAALARAATVEEVAEVVVAEGIEALGAEAGLMAVRKGEEGELVRAVGYPERFAERYARFPLTEPMGMAEAMRTGEAVWFGSAHDWRRRYGREPTVALPSGGATPLMSAGRALGAIGFRFAAERDFGEDERAFVATLAQQCAQALLRAQSYDERLEVSEALQRSLLPADLPHVPGAALAVRYLPAARGLEVGGDWYEAVRLPDGRLGVAVGDVVGRGLAAAAVMGQLRSALRAFALSGEAPGAVLERLSAFAETVEGAEVSTLVYAVLDPASGELRYACAGHPPPLVLEDSGRATYLNGGRAAPLATRVGGYPEGRATLPAGSSLLLYSDGAVERRGEVIDAGLERLARIASRAQGEDPESLCTHLLDGLFRGEPPGDDVALLAVRVVGAPLEPLGFTVPARADQLARVRGRVTEWLGEAGASSEEGWDVLIACGEACANAIEHAYRGQAQGTLDVELEHEGTGTIVMRVRDHGRWRPRREPHLRGKGLLLMRKTMDDLRVLREEAGTTVVLRRRIGADLPPGGGKGEEGGEGGSGAPTEDPHVDVEVAQGPWALLRLAGAIDVGSARGLDERLAAGGGGGLLGVVLDLTEVSYLDSAGVGVLLGLARACADTGRRLWLVSPPASAARRTLELSGAHRLLTIDTAPPTGRGD